MTFWALATPVAFSTPVPVASVAVLAAPAGPLSIVHSPSLSYNGYLSQNGYGYVYIYIYICISYIYI